MNFLLFFCKNNILVSTLGFLLKCLLDKEKDHPDFHLRNGIRKCVYQQMKTNQGEAGKLGKTWSLGEDWTQVTAT